MFIAECPQAFAAWITHHTGIKVTGRLATEFVGRNLNADALLDVEMESQEMLLHVEFQSTNDKEMPERLLEYSFRAKQEHKKVVYSCVIFLRQDGIVPEPPLSWEMPNGELILLFQFSCIKLWELTPEDLPTVDLPALLPLTLLTKGGASRPIAEKMFTGLQAGGLTGLCSIGYALASLVFKDEGDQAWLERMYAEMSDILKDTPLYRRMTEDARQDGWAEGMEKGIERGRQEGIEKGREVGIEKGIEKGKVAGREEGIESMRKVLEGIVAERFPALTRFVHQLLPPLKQLDLLQSLVIQISIAQDESEVKCCLVEAVKQEIG